MAIVINAKGTSVSSFTIGKQGPAIKNNSGKVEFKDFTDLTFTNFRSAGIDDNALQQVITIDTDESVRIYRDSGDSSETLTVIQDSADSTGSVLAIGNDGHGDALRIINTNTARGLSIDNDASSLPALYIITTGTGKAIDVGDEKFTVDKDGQVVCKNISIADRTIKEIDDPIEDLDVANKHYVDASLAQMDTIAYDEYVVSGLSSIQNEPYTVSNFFSVIPSNNSTILSVNGVILRNTNDSWSRNGRDLILTPSSIGFGIDNDDVIMAYYQSSFKTTIYDEYIISGLFSIENDPYTISGFFTDIPANDTVLLSINGVIQRNTNDSWSRDNYDLILTPSNIGFGLDNSDVVLAYYQRDI